jgi:hypothetical protein
MGSLVFCPGLPFFLSTRRTMKKSYLLVAVVLAVIVAFAFLMVRPDRLRQKIASDVQKVNARFTPADSIDLSMAMKLTTHEAPQMLNPPAPVRPLLLFPPSDEDLAKLSGV